MATLCGAANARISPSATHFTKADRRHTSIAAHKRMTPERFAYLRTPHLFQLMNVVKTEYPCIENT